MKSIDELLNCATQAGASDLHVKVGSPPIIRVDGELQSLDEPVCSPDDTKDYAASSHERKTVSVVSARPTRIDFAYISFAGWWALQGQSLTAGEGHIDSLPSGVTSCP
jgi:Tfp pilus assembly pilus retraction ATPase PilT